jgi:L-ascorbate metabolism protein UlaG (beta-lactamase superfamily)
VKLTLIRSATLRIEVAGHTLLVDPQLDPAGAREAVPNTPNPRPTPMVGLPFPAEQVVAGVDAVLLTHVHGDHWDATARELLPHEIPIFCQPHDAERLHSEGFIDARPVFGDATLDELLIVRTDGHHGTGEIGEAMGIVSGFVLHAPGEPSVYLAGDTILCEEVRKAIDEHRSAAVVVNASAARFNEGDAIVMTNDEVLALAREYPATTVGAVHFETVSHATETRADLRARIGDLRILVPEDGEEIAI